MRFLLSIFIFQILIFQASIAQKISYNIDDVYVKGIFSPKYVSGFNSTPDGEFYTERTATGIEKKDFKTGLQSSLILEYSTLPEELKSFSDYTLSEDQSKMLIFTSPKQIYRHSISYIVYVYDLKNKSFQKVDDDKILHATLSPDNQKIAYVKDNNLYIQNLSNKEVVQVTKDGKWNHIINGNCDWVYEEEFGFTQAFQWSEDGQYIAFYKFDESCVKEFTMQYFHDLYPENYTFKYPKAGEDNSKVSLHLYTLQTRNTEKINIPIEDEFYIPRIFWGKNNNLAIVTLNRLQNHKNIFYWNANTKSIKNVYDEKDEAYVEVDDNIRFLSDNSFILSSEKNGFNHLYWYDENGKLKKQLTDGNFEIRTLYGVSEKDKKVYFSSTQASELENHLYSVDLKKGKIQKMTIEAGWHEVNFSSNFAYFLDQYSTTNQPLTYKLKNKSAKTIKLLEDNATFLEKYNKYQNAPVEFIKIPVNDVELNATIMKPANFDENKKYPVLIYQYSGPGSQNVKNMFFQPHHFLHQIMVQKGYVIINVDTRGTGGRGAKFKKQSYRQLGKYESDDLIATAQWLQNQSFVDKDRIGLWGWSYGGYMSSICILKGADVFKTAVAIAPVTNWRYYDNIYTERYMGLPKDNADGYDDNSPTSMVDKLKGNFLIIHGLADDNVHFQNSAMLVNGLIEANKYFEGEYYPNRAHGIGGKNGRRHVYNRILNYITEKL